MVYFLVFSAGFDFSLTQLDVTVQCEEDVASLQVSVYDIVVMEVDKGLQSLLTHHPDLRLRQGSLQFCRVTQMHEIKSNVIYGRKDYATYCYATVYWVIKNVICWWSI